jgi:polynucleotide 5'-hydroxyl-kinase GRC3/NOL9
MDGVVPFPPGQHSFYGFCGITIISGCPSFHGADFPSNSSFILTAPLHRLPISCESDLPFTLRISPRPRTTLLPEEEKYYFPRTPPDGFTEIAAGFFHSQLIRGPSYPPAAHRFVDNLLSRSPSVIFVSGDNSSGKSTFATYLVNRVLSRHQSVCFVDLDPGQTELALPGFLSLSILTDYITSPPEFRTATGQTVVFYGSLSPGNNHIRYLECVRFLSEKIPSGVFTIVNSFGWVRDLGLELHGVVIDVVHPGTTFVLHRPDEVPAEVAQRTFRVEISLRQAPIAISPADHRILRINGHFRRSTERLSDQQPIAIPFSAIRIGFVCVVV